MFNGRSESIAKTLNGKSGLSIEMAEINGFDLAEIRG